MEYVFPTIIIFFLKCSILNKIQSLILIKLYKIEKKNKQKRKLAQGNKRKHCFYEKECDAVTFRTIKEQERPRENEKN